MFIGLMKKIFLTLLVSTCLTSISLAENIADIRTRQIEDGLYNLLYIHQQIQAVDNDMILYFGWMPEEKQGMKDTAQQSIQELSHLRTKLMSVGMPLELADVKNELMDVLEKQKNIYRGVETKTDEQIRASYVNFQKIIDTQIEHVGQKLDEYLTAPRMPDDFSVIQEELRLFTDLNDQALFKQAADLLESKQIKSSYEILSGLREKYKNTPDGEPPSNLIIMACPIGLKSPIWNITTNGWISSGLFNSISSIIQMTTGPKYKSLLY